jgi:hypothetical protein
VTSTLFRLISAFCLLPSAFPSRRLPESPQSRLSCDSLGQSTLQATCKRVTPVLLRYLMGGPPVSVLSHPRRQVWSEGSLGGGFLICERRHGRQAVKKLHLGFASSGYCPCPNRASTLWGWLTGVRILNIEKLSARATPKPPKATPRPYCRHILGIDSGVQGHTKATPRPHQGHTKATPRLPQGYPKATPRPPQGYPKATFKPANQASL